MATAPRLTYGFEIAIAVASPPSSLILSRIDQLLQRSHEKYPSATPRTITDNGPQFVARDFTDFLRVAGMTRVRTSPYYPPSSGKIERWNRTVKAEEVRLHPSATIDEARTRASAIWAERDRKLEQAREARATRRTLARQEVAAAQSAVEGMTNRCLRTRLTQLSRSR